MAHLISFTKDGSQQIELTDLLVLGRDPHCDLPLGDPAVSRRHAEIRREDRDRYRLVDLGSTHGTFVWGRPVDELLLAHGDEITLGQTRFRFEQPESAQQDHPIASGSQSAASVTARWRPITETRFPTHDELRDISELRRQYAKLRAAQELSRAIGVEQELDVVLQKMLDTTLELLNADRGVLVLLDEVTGSPTVRFESRSAGVGEEAVLSETILQEVIHRKEAVISADAAADIRFRGAGSIVDQGIRSTMCVPMLHEDGLVGALQLVCLRASNVFGDSDLEIFGSIANQAAMLVKNAMLRRRIELASAEERKRLQWLVHHLPQGVVLLDAEERVLLRNEAATVLPLILEGGRLVGLGPTRLADLSELRPGVEMDVLLPGPTTRIFAVSVGRAAEPRPGQAATVFVVRDVTHEREQEERTARADRLALVGQLSGGIAHDFKNLLGVIVAHAELAAESADGEMREDLEAMSGAAMRAAALTNQLLAFSRKDEVAPVRLDVNGVVREVEKLARPTLGKKVALELRLEQPLGAVFVDPGRLEQVLMNLVVNGRDAMPEGGRVEVATANLAVNSPVTVYAEDLPAGSYVRLTVSDTGCGMSPDVVAHLFEPFFTTKPKGQGTGLGLATAYGTVKRAGGGIAVESTPGRGTTFIVYLPVDPE